MDSREAPSEPRCAQPQKVAANLRQNCYPARHLSSVDLAPPSTLPLSLRRRDRVPCSVSSWAQTDDRQTTVTTPPRSLTGVALGGDRRRPRPRATRAARRRAGSPARGVARAPRPHRRADRRATAQRPRSHADDLGQSSLTTHAATASWRIAPSVTATRATSGAARARHVPEVGRRDERLPARPHPRRRAARGGRRRARSSRRRAGAAARHRAPRPGPRARRAAARAGAIRCSPCEP